MITLADSILPALSLSLRLDIDKISVEVFSLTLLGIVLTISSIFYFFKSFYNKKSLTAL